MTAGACRDAGLPGHECTGTVHQFIGGSLCATSAPPQPAPPPPGTTAVDLAARKAAVAALLERARRLSAVEVERINDSATDLGFREGVAAMKAVLGWHTAEGIDETLNAVYRARSSIAGHASVFDAWTLGLSAGRRTGLHRAGMSVLAWTAAAVAARDVLPAETYGAVTAIWRGAVGHAHPEDGSRGAPARELDETAPAVTQ